jgi:hypothetical protein
MAKLTTEYFITKAKIKHKDRYDYSLTRYIGNAEKVDIICKIHGVFKQIANDHLSGKGCSRCNKTHKHTTKEAIDMFINTHGDTYNYVNVNYVNNRTKVSITCKKHGEFTQTPKQHKRGEGCPKCGIIKSTSNIYNSKGFYSDKRANRHKDKWGNIPAILYFVKIISYDETFYKVGITTKSIKERFGNVKANIEVILEHKTNLYEACLLENKLILDNIKHKYIAKSFINHGNTECFSKPINISEINKN